MAMTALHDINLIQSLIQISQSKIKNVTQQNYFFGCYRQLIFEICLMLEVTGGVII
jgi:hypothetical protein